MIPRTILSNTGFCGPKHEETKHLKPKEIKPDNAQVPKTYDEARKKALGKKY